MVYRKKRLEKQIDSLKRRSKEHLDKAKEKSASEILKDYWLKEAKIYGMQAKEKEKMLGKLKREKK